MKHLTLRSKLWLAFGSILTILLLVGGIGFQAAQSGDEHAQTVELNLLKQKMAVALKFGVEKEKVGSRDMLLSGNPANLKAARAAFDRQVTEIRPFVTTPEGQQIFSRVLEKHSQFDNEVDTALHLDQSGHRDEAIKSFYGGAVTAQRVALEQATDTLGDLWSGRATAAKAEQTASSKKTLLLIPVFAALGLLLGITVTVFTIRSIIGAITPVVEVMQQISNNNLDVEDVPVLTRDELGNAAVAVNQMKENLSRVITSIVASALQLAASIEEISKNAEQARANTSSEAEQAAQVASAINEMSAAVSEVANHANAAALASVQSSQAAAQGGQVVDDTLATMNRISTATGNVTARLVDLGQSSRKIDSIVSVISEIAAQTNLLALNAAIEAARAGEQGRGFAVVANEVRNLAERTASATKEVALMIGTIQTETRVAVEAIEKGNLEVEAGVAKTGESGRALGEIIRASESVGNMVAQIATAAAEQESATEMISSSVSQISKLSQMSSISSDDTAQACNDLSQMVSELHLIVNAFTLPNSEKSSRSNRPA